MSDDTKPYGMRPEVEAAWNFPLFEAMMGRRSRRFGFGMELEYGPFTYKSEKEPFPLSEDETAILVAAATLAGGWGNWHLFQIHKKFSVISCIQITYNK